MQTRLDRAERTVESSRDVVERRTGEESEFDDLAMLFRQASHRMANPPGVFGHFGGSIGQASRAGFLAEGVGSGKANVVLVSSSFQESVP